MYADPQKKLHDLLTDFSAAMLVTRTTAGELRSRPMAVAAVEDDGVLWFMTQRHSGKLEEIAADSHVNVAMQSGTKFISVSGDAAAVEDRRKVDELWNPMWKHWFPKGKDDPDLVLIRVTPDAGEYWDNSDLSGLKYLLAAGKAYFTGTKPDVDDPDIHGKVSM
jgi:general stress protein 26